MNIPKETVDAFEFESIEKLHQARRSRINDEILVRFSSSRTKDLVQSFAPNLASANGKAGLRMCIPPHLLGLFKMCEIHGGKLRQKFGPGLKRSIKFDDASMSLAMDVKLPNDPEWVHMSRQDIVKVTRDRADKESLFGASNDRGTQGQRLRSILLRSPSKESDDAPHLLSADEDDEESVRTDPGARVSSGAA